MLEYRLVTARQTHHTYMRKYSSRCIFEAKYKSIYTIIQLIRHDSYLSLENYNALGYSRESFPRTHSSASADRRATRVDEILAIHKYIQ